jgi:hypothetical protein
MILRRSGNERRLNALDVANARRVESGGRRSLVDTGNLHAPRRHGRVFYRAWRCATIVKARLRIATNIISTGHGLALGPLLTLCACCFTVRLAAAAAYTHMSHLVVVFFLLNHF